MKWTKDVNGSNVSYHPAPQTKYAYTVESTDCVEVDDIKNAMNGDKSTGVPPTQVEGHIITYKSVPNEGEDLPAGTYSHIPSNYLSNERLDARLYRKNEAYIQITNAEHILSDMLLFKRHQKTYEDIGVSYRRGYLIYGAPGNGKTALLRNLLSKEEFTSAQVVWCRDLPSNSFLECLNATPNLKIVVFEELLDSQGSSNYDMARLLEVLDGESSLANCITIATTNYPELLAKNLADRPSRFDMVVEVGNPSQADASRLLEFFLKRPVLNDEIVVKNYSVAHLKEIVILHKLHGISLQDAANKMSTQSENFKSNFQEKKAFGL